MLFRPVCCLLRTRREEVIKLYVCWGTFRTPGHEHSCRAALLKLQEAGYEPEVVKAHSFGGIPRALQTPTRKKIEDETGSPWVPALETDDGQWISGSAEIVAWAEANRVPATAVAV